MIAACGMTFAGGKVALLATHIVPKFIIKNSFATTIAELSFFSLESRKHRTEIYANAHS